MTLSSWASKLQHPCVWRKVIFKRSWWIRSSLRKNCWSFIKSFKSLMKKSKEYLPTESSWIFLSSSLLLSDLGCWTDCSSKLIIRWKRKGICRMSMLNLKTWVECLKKMMIIKATTSKTKMTMMKIRGRGRTTKMEQMGSTILLILKNSLPKWVKKLTLPLASLQKSCLCSTQEQVSTRKYSSISVYLMLTRTRRSTEVIWTQ